MPFLHTKKSNLCRTAVEDLIEPGKEGDGGDGGGQNVADRLGQKHAEHCIRQNMRQNEDEGDQQNDLAQAGQQQADLSLPKRHKALLAGDLEAHGKNARHINAHGPRGVLDQCGVRGENARHRAGKQHHQQPEQAGVGPAQRQLKTEGFLDAGLLACAEVEAHHRLSALTDALNGQRAQLGCAGDDGHGTHSHIAAVPRQTGAEADGKQAFGGEHHKRGDAQRQHRQNDLLFRAQVVSAQAQDGLFAGEKADDPCSAHGLTEHRGNGRAPHAQPEPEDQDGVEDNVDHRADHGGKHTGLGKALRGDKRVHAQHHQHEHRACNVDAAVAQGVRQGGIAGTEQPQQHRCPGIEANGQHHGKEHQYGKAVGDDLFGLLPVPLPQSNGGARRAARAHQHGKSVQQHQNGCEQPHAGQRCRANARNVADVNAVHDVIQQIHDLRYHGGDHELQHQLFDAAGAHILFCLCHWNALLYTSNLKNIVPIILGSRPKEQPFLQRNRAFCPKNAKRHGCVWLAAVPCRNGRKVLTENRFFAIL